MRIAINKLPFYLQGLKGMKHIQSLVSRACLPVSNTSQTFITFRAKDNAILVRIDIFFCA